MVLLWDVSLLSSLNLGRMEIFHRCTGKHWENESIVSKRGRYVTAKVLKFV